MSMRMVRIKTSLVAGRTREDFNNKAMIAWALEAGSLEVDVPKLDHQQLTIQVPGSDHCSSVNFNLWLHNDG